MFCLNLSKHWTYCGSCHLPNKHLVMKLTGYWQDNMSSPTSIYVPEFHHPISMTNIFIWYMLFKSDSRRLQADWLTLILWPYVSYVTCYFLGNISIADTIGCCPTISFVWPLNLRWLHISKNFFFFCFQLILITTVNVRLQVTHTMYVACDILCFILE